MSQMRAIYHGTLYLKDVTAAQRFISAGNNGGWGKARGLPDVNYELKGAISRAGDEANVEGE